MRCCCVSSGLFCLLKETRQRVDELQSALQQAQAFKLQTETEVSGYQAELAELRYDPNCTWKDLSWPLNCITSANWVTFAHW